MRVLFITLLFLSASLLAKDTLKVGYTLAPPFIEKQNGELTGASMWLWNQVNDTANYHYEYKELTLDQILVGLQSNQLDLSINPLTINHDRIQSMRFSVPFYVAHSSFIEDQETTVESFKSAISSFFSLQFFQALGGLVLVIMIFGFLAWFFERKKNPEEFKPGWSGLWSGFWWSAVTMTTVGYGDKSPRSLGGRIIALIWMFTAIIIISGFTASIASALTVNQISTGEVSLQDAKKLNIGTIKNSSTEKWLKENFYPNRVSFENFEELVEAKKNQAIDLIAYDRPILQYFIENQANTDFQLSQVTFNPQFLAFTFSRKLDQKMIETINRGLLKEVESHDWQIILSEFGLK